MIALLGIINLLSWIGIGYYIHDSNYWAVFGLFFLAIFTSLIKGGMEVLNADLKKVDLGGE